MDDTIKLCKNCGNEYSITEFVIKNTTGISRTCKLCKQQKSREYEMRRKERRKLYNKEWYVKKKESGHIFKPTSPEAMKKWRIANSDKIKEYGKSYYSQNIESIKLKKINYRKNNKDLIRAYNKEWRSKNPDRCGELSARRRARKRYATPKWLTEDDYNAIRAFYTEAQRLTLETGIDHAVDHIHPLLGELVCGLHVPWNLQILTKSENSAKGNRLLTEDNS
jgi:5-methylcytosine-specific restriction endonuclease McrA